METINNDGADTSPRSAEETTKTRPRRSSVTNRSSISVRVVSPPPQTCFKCTRKSGKLLTCRNCNKGYHKTCVSAIDDTNNLEFSTYFNDWLCSTCENTQLIEALEAKLGEIESNSWRMMVTCEEDESGVSSDEEVVDDSSMSSEQMRQQPRRPVINFDSPLKDGKS